MVYAIPGFLLALWIAHLLRHEITHLANTSAVLNQHITSASSAWNKTKASFAQSWDKKPMGYGAAFVFGRRPAKGASTTSS